MPQQVNFLKDEFRKRKENFTARQGLLFIVLIIAGVFAYSSEQQRELASLQVEVKQAQQEEILKTGDLNALRMQYSVKDKGKELDQRLVEVKALIEEKSHLKETLGVNIEEQFEGFSPFFIALARQHDPSLWFTEISITKANRAVVLMGKTVSPGALPDYLKRLSKESVFTGMHFNEFKMLRDNGKKSKKYIDFLLTTVPNERTLADAVASN